MRLFLTIITFSLLSSCANNSAEIKTSPAQVDLPKYVQELVKNMSGGARKVRKTFVLNKVSESKIYSQTDAAFWTKELSLLASIDLNSPQIIGSFKLQEGENDQYSNLLIDNYTFSTKGDLGLKNLSVYYLDDPNDIRHIKAEFATKNLISESNRLLNIWVNQYGTELMIDSIKILSQDKTLMRPVRNYKSVTSVVE